MEQLEQLKYLVSTFNWHSASWDLFIFLFWLVASTMYAFAAGRGRILSVMVSIYMAKLLVIEAPFLSTEISKQLNITVLSLQQLAAFAVIFLLLFIFLARYAFKTGADGRRLLAIPFSLAFAVLQIGLLINIVLTLLPEHVQNNFSPLVKFVFIQDPASFVWLVLPAAFIVLLGKFISERHEM
jgi:hypothetical protein